MQQLSDMRPHLADIVCMVEEEATLKFVAYMRKKGYMHMYQLYVPSLLEVGAHMAMA